MVIFIPIFFYPIIGNAEEGGDNPPAETVEAPADEKPAENVKTDVIILLTVNFICFPVK